MIKEQKIVEDKLRRIFEVFIASEGAVRPHFMLTGPSGSGKSYIIKALADEVDINFIEINAAQLTKEGTAGNSLSKALSPLMSVQGLAICFVDEFDKLFISGNSNTQLAHETTNGVQNEFLKVLESEKASVFGDYGKYHSVSVDNVLFVFAGAFNGESDLTVDKLREFGIKTEFLGRVGLIFNLTKLSLESMAIALNKSELLSIYLTLFKDVDSDEAKDAIFEVVEKNHENNTLGIRLLNHLIHQYFINDGDMSDGEVAKVAFQNKLSFNK